jgi:hypothetical protein
MQCVYCLCITRSGLFSRTNGRIFLPDEYNFQSIDLKADLTEYFISGERSRGIDNNTAHGGKYGYDNAKRYTG